MLRVSNTRIGGNIHLVPPKPKENHNFVAYSTAYSVDKKWEVTPYTYNQETKEYLPDGKCCVFSKSRTGAIENLMVKYFGAIIGEEISLNRIQCID